MTNEDYLKGLQTERAGYVARGLDDRVAEVDAEITRVEQLLDVAPVEEVATTEEAAEPTPPETEEVVAPVEEVATTVDRKGKRG